jgi:putative nucleotidyltransferase with HDIG domain
MGYRMSETRKEPLRWDAKEMQRRLDSIQDLPTLPAVATEVVELISDPDTSIGKLSAAIEKDQVITARILKLVNSAFFGLPSMVGNIPHALVLLGFSTVRNAVLSVSVVNVLSQKKALGGFDISEFWKHSIAVAVTSRILAERTRLQASGDSFTGGLLHDVGKFVLSQFFPALFKEVWAAMQEKGCTYSEAEKEIPLHHGAIGACLARKWKLPVELVDVIHHHHAPVANADSQRLLAIVRAADWIVNSGPGTGEQALLTHYLGPLGSGKMGSVLDTVSQWYPEAMQEADAACAFFLEGAGP